MKRIEWMCAGQRYAVETPTFLARRLYAGDPDERIAIMCPGIMISLPAGTEFDVTEVEG